MSWVILDFFPLERSAIASGASFRICLSKKTTRLHGVK